MARDHILAIDQGTTSTRVVIYNSLLKSVGQAQVEVPPAYPRSGWVEHDAQALLDSVLETIPSALKNASIAADRIACLGITNQRETTILWDKRTGKAIHPALVWQDRRTADQCTRLKSLEPDVKALTGLVIDPYFSATKIAWILENEPKAAELLEKGELAAGTVDAFLLWHLTGGSVHAIDETNASRTLLLDLKTRAWSPRLCEVFGVPLEILPKVVKSAGIAGETRGLGILPDGLPISGIAGDQQASLIGQGCLTNHQVKCTYGTGAFLLANTGTQPIFSKHGMLTTLAASVGSEGPLYAIEGSVFVAGAAVQWFRDGLKAIGEAPGIDTLSLDAGDTSELIFVPVRLRALGAPYWKPDVRGSIFGITRATTVADLARATLEGVAFQVVDLLDAVAADLGRPVAELRADGGMARSDPFLQCQADFLGIPVRRSPETESTALGAAMLAGLGVGLWKSATEAAELLSAGGKVFRPRLTVQAREGAVKRWREAVATVIGHYSQSRRLSPGDVVSSLRRLVNVRIEDAHLAPAILVFIDELEMPVVLEVFRFGILVFEHHMERNIEVAIADGSFTSSAIVPTEHEMRSFVPCEVFTARFDELLAHLRGAILEREVDCVRQFFLARASCGGHSRNSYRRDRRTQQTGRENLHRDRLLQGIRSTEPQHLHPLGLRSQASQARSTGGVGAL